MQDFQRQIAQAVHNFTGEITDLAQRVAIDMVSGALSKTPKSGRPVSLPSASNGEDRRPKRDESAIHEAQDKFLTFVRANPGQRIEHINRALGTTTKDLALPIRKLIASKQIRVEGRRRATTYFVQGAASDKPKKNGSVKSKKKATKSKGSKSGTSKGKIKGKSKKAKAKAAPETREDTEGTDTGKSN